MSKQTIIPVGYIITVTSWENDADHYNTKIFNGLTKERVAFYVELLGIFNSRNSRRDTENFGNMYEPSDEELTTAFVAIHEVMLKHRSALKDYELDAVVENDIQDVAFDIIGDLLGNSEDYTFRVFDGIKIEYVPSEIKLQDVTSEFVKCL